MQIIPKQQTVVDIVNIMRQIMDEMKNSILEIHSTKNEIIQFDEVKEFELKDYLFGIVDFGDI